MDDHAKENHPDKVVLRLCPHCSGRLDDDKIIEWGGWSYDEVGRWLKPGNIKVTAMEGAMISALLRMKGKVAGKATVLYSAFCTAEKSEDEWPSVKIVDVVISKLRKKLDDCKLHMIETTWGTGYFAVAYDPDKLPIDRRPLRGDAPPKPRRVHRFAMCECGHYAKAHQVVSKNGKRTFCRNCVCTSFNRKTNNENQNGL